MSSNFASPNRAVYLIMLALVVWGSLLALGAFLFDFDVRKFFVVMGAVGAFLLFWLLLIVTQRRGPRSWEADELAVKEKDADGKRIGKPD